MSVIRWYAVIMHLLFLMIFNTLFSLQLGSASNIICTPSFISLVPYTVFPNTDNDNTMLAFGFFKHGFALQDATTSCTFSSVFPVSGPVNLNGGTLYLDNDLIFQNHTNFMTAGSIIGNNHVLELAQSVTTIPATYQTVFENITIFLNSDITVSGTIKFLGKTMIDGWWHGLSLGQDAQIVIGPNASLELRNLDISGISGYKICCLDNSGRLILNNVELGLSGNYTFTLGSITYDNSVNIFGGCAFNYASALTSTIAQNTDLTFDVGMTLSYDPPNQEQDLINFASPSSRLIFNADSNLYIGPGGLLLTTGQVVFDTSVSIFMAWPNSVLCLGNNFSSDDIALNILAYTMVEIVNGTLVYQNINSSSLNIALNSFIRMDAGTTLNLMQTMPMGQGRLQLSTKTSLIKSPYAASLTGPIDLF